MKHARKNIIKMKMKEDISGVSVDYIRKSKSNCGMSDVSIDILG